MRFKQWLNEDYDYNNLSDDELLREAIRGRIFRLILWDL